MQKRLYAEAFKPFFELDRRRLSVEFVNNNAAHKKPRASECVHKTQNVAVVCYAVVTSDFVAFNISRGNNNNNLRMVFQVKEHLQFTVGFEAREYAGRVKVIKKFTAELKIKFTAEFVDALHNLFGLFFDIHIVVKTDFLLKNHINHPFTKYNFNITLVFCQRKSNRFIDFDIH